MGQKDTGSSTNSEPNDNEIAPNIELEQPRIDVDSDSDVEDVEDINEHQWRYLPLSQNPNNDDPVIDSGDEDLPSPTQDIAASSSSEPEIKEAATALVEEVWSKPAPKEVEIEMSASKIDLVKEAMGNFSLPPEAIPNWAKNIPEDQWKEHLMKKLNLPNK